MERPGPDAHVEAVVARYRTVAVLVVFAVTTSTWVGWATGIEPLTRIYPGWPPMTPWTAVWLGALGAAILLQSGDPRPARMWAGRGLAAIVSVLTVAVLAEYVTGGAFGLDRVWFAEAVRLWQWPRPGRPSPQTSSAILLLAVVAALIRVDRWDRGTRLAWPICVAGAASIPFITIGAYLFDALALVGVTPSAGEAISTASSLLLLVAAVSLARVDRFPLGWLLARPDWRSLVRLMCILGGFPIVVALSRPAFLALGVGAQAEWTFSILLGTVIVGAVTFYFSQREQKLLIEKQLVSKERADAEMRYRILADNAVDIVIHLRGGDVAWVSPSVEAALGGPAQQWTGAGLRRRIHPDDRDTLATALQRIAGGEAVLHRFRVRAIDEEYHWVHGHGKPYVDAEGNTDGLIAALRIVDDQVEAEQRLERLARFDTLTGLANRAEAIGRLEAALEQPRRPGTGVGVLFCDVDYFKEINDTWGHGIGDAVLATLAARIRASVRQGDTVGRTGGDEILILLPGVHSIDEVAEIAEKIRCRAAEPIQVSEQMIRATLSIGATIALPGEPVSSITARADAAMYKAKSGDKNTVIRV
ncbi:MAG TPA: sensor domain-containing diguanylate cyclase [Mycobacterium sp.]